MPKKLLIVVNVDWFFLSHRLPIALGALAEGYEVHIATEITDKLAEIESHGLIVHPLAIKRNNSNLFGAINLIKDLFDICRTVQPDVAHFVTIKPVLLGGIVARFAKVPRMIAAISGLGFLFINDSFRSRVTRAIAVQLYRFSLGHKNLCIIVQNSHDLATIRNLTQLPDSSFRLLSGSGVDLSNYSPQLEPTGIPVVIFAARMLLDKGVVEFVNAAKLLKSKGIISRFILVGEPDLANPTSITTTQLEDWHKEGIIEWWGKRNDIPQVFAQANLVVLPSYYGEGLPKVLIEAAACGRAIITTDNPGCREAIEPDVTGLMVPIKDTQSLANAIEKLIIDPDLRHQMGTAGRKRAEEIFPIEKIVAAHLEIYRDSIGNFAEATVSPVVKLVNKT